MTLPERVRYKRDWEISNVYTPLILRICMEEETITIDPPHGDRVQEQMEHEIKIDRNLCEDSDMMTVKIGSTTLIIFNHPSGRKSIGVHGIDESLELNLFHGIDNKITKTKRKLDTFARTNVKVN